MTNFINNDGPKTYEERVGRYRIMRHDAPTDEVRAIYVKKGMDPDDQWKLIWSFETRGPAEELIEQLKADAAEWETYKLVDNGAASIIERPVY